MVRGVPASGRFAVRSNRWRCAALTIEPGKTVQNASIESFDGRFRDEWLNLHWVRSLQHARQEIGRWRDHDDTVRPHSAPGYLSPREVLTITTATAPGTPAVSAPPLNT
jgi:putative transposase